MSLADRMLDAIDDGVFSIDRDLRVTTWNHHMQTLTGVMRDAIVGRPLFDVLPQWRAARGALKTALDGTASEAMLPLGVPGKRFDASYTPLGSDGCAVVVRDATPIEAAKQEAIESDARFRVMADTSPVLLWMSGTDGLCTFFNQRWLAFTGRTMEMEIGNGWAEGVHPEDFQRCMDTYLRAFVAREPFRMEYRLRRADGEYRWLLDTGVPRHLPSGAFAGYIGSCVDVTELTLARTELDRRVRERTAELEAFSYSVSHDLRAPLRGIEGFGRALQSEYGDKLDENARHYVDRMRNAAQHMASLIDGMLQLSRIGRRDLKLEDCDLTTIARDVARTLKEQHPERTTEIEIEEGMQVKGDRQLLRIALDNLIGNAWKFTSKTPDAKIIVGSLVHDGARVYVVRDNGVGFDMAHAGKLFGAFQRLHHQSEFPGTGIGLATVQRIVTRHSGRIWAEAEIDRGAAFYLSFPRKAQTPEQTA